MKKIYVLGTMLVLLMAMSIIPSSISAVSANNTKCVIAPASNELNEYQDFSGITSFADVTVYDDFDIMQSSSSEVYLNAAIKRYIVLLLDTSGEKWIQVGVEDYIEIGASFEKVQKAALNFVKQVMYAPGENYVAVVGFDADIKEQGKFYDTLAPLEEAINNLEVALNWVNTNAALTEAGRLLGEVEDTGAIKNIICFSGWMPSDGTYDLLGPYYPSIHYNYVRLNDGKYIVGFCNSAYKTAQRLRGQGYNIYMLACFTNLDNHQPTLTFTRRVMKDLSVIPNALGNPSRYYEAENPEDLDYIFGDAFKDIWGALWWQEYVNPSIWQVYDEFGYNMNDGTKKGHLGIDYLNEACTWLPLDVVAVTRGEVIFAGEEKFNGNVVFIKHEVEGIIFYSAYFHLASFDDKIKGASVSNPIPVYCGQKLGVMGKTGESSGGLHLHLAIFTVKTEDTSGEYDIFNGKEALPGWKHKFFTPEEKATDNVLVNKDTHGAWHLGDVWEFLFYDPQKVIEGTSSLVNKANYRPKVIHIACPVDVNVYDSKNNLVASVVNDKVIVDKLSTFAYNGIKIYLDQGDDYRIEIIATDDGVMDYSITEIDGNSRDTRKVMMNNIPLTTGEVFTGYVNTEKGMPSETYELTSSTGQKYYADEDLTGSALRNIAISTHAVLGEEKVSIRTGMYTKGDGTTVYAYYEDGIERKWDFEGWYENGVKIEGAGVVYSFIVTENRELTAHLVPKAVPIYTFTTMWPIRGGSILGGGQFDEYAKNSVITVKAIPDTGYVFDGWYELDWHGNGVKVSSDATYSFAITEDTRLEARFSPIYTITTMASTGGKVSGGGTFGENSVVTVKATPDIGYTFEGWYENNVKVSEDAEYSFTVTANRILVARFTRLPASINIAGISVGNGQVNIDFNILSANGKGYSVYLSLSEEEGTFKLYADVNYNSKGVHIKGLTNGETYYVYIAYSDAGAVLRSNVIKFTVNQ